MDKQIAHEILDLIEWMYNEYNELWCMRNYEKGKETFLNILDMHRAEVAAFIE